jgi:hypothetical protein
MIYAAAALTDRWECRACIPVLMGSSIETIESVVKVNCFRAEGLPDMDRVGGEGQGMRCDPFVSVKIGGIR